MDGLSLRVVARKLQVSKESVRQWILKFEEAFARKKLARKKERDVILLDATKVKRNVEMAYVTICLDLERREVVSSLASRSLSSLFTINVVKQALKSCKSTPVLITDHAPRYRCAFRSLGLCNNQRTFSFRNYIERWYRTFSIGRGDSSTTFRYEIPQERSSESTDSYIFSHMVQPHETS